MQDPDSGGVQDREELGGDTLMLPELTLWQRIKWWVRYHWERRRCDGCSKRFTLSRIDPVSGDYWLCRNCFPKWYPEFFGGADK